MNTKTPKIVRLRDIADRARLSVTAISLALKDSPEIGTATRAKIRKIARDMGYTSPASRGLGRAGRPRGRRFGLLFVGAETEADTTHAILSGASGGASRVGARIEVMMLPDKTDSAEAVAQAIAFARPLNGVLVWGHVGPRLLSTLASEKMPYLVLGRTSALAGEIPGPLVSGVTNDYSGMGWLATEWLIRRGHTRIGFVCETMPPRLYNSSWYTGYRNAHFEANLPIDPALCHVEPREGLLGDRAVEAMFNLRPPPTAYVLSDADAAKRFIDALKRQSAALPDDAIVIGVERTALDRQHLSHHPLILGDLAETTDIAMRALGAHAIGTNGADSGVPLLNGVLHVPFKTMNMD